MSAWWIFAVWISGLFLGCVVANVFPRQDR